MTKSKAEARGAYREIEFLQKHFAIAQCVDCGGTHTIGTDEDGLLVKLEPCPRIPICRVSQCNNVATWEGWYQRGNSLHQEKITVCDEHRAVLRGDHHD